MPVLLKERNNSRRGDHFKSTINYCKVKDEYDIIEYEKALYDAFMDRNPNNWLVKNYELIDNCRFKSKIQYKDQGVYIVKKNKKIVMGIAINYNMNRLLQLEEIGFEICKSDEICEGLLFFSNEKELKGENFFIIVSKLFNLAKNDFYKKKIKRVFSTCSKNLLNMYQLFDFFPIQKKITCNNEEKYLLCCVIV